MMQASHGRGDQIPLGRWDELNVFLSDGAVAIDNDVSEREMKRVVLNQKNSLFVGNARGGRTAAILGEPHFKLPPPRYRPAALSHPTAGQLAVAADMRPAGLAARQMEGRTECDY